MRFDKAINLKNLWDDCSIAQIVEQETTLLFTFVLFSLRLVLHPAWQALMYILLSEPQTGEYLT